MTVRVVRGHGHLEAKNGLAEVMTVMVNHNLYGTYLKKEEDSTVLYDNYDQSAVQEFFEPKRRKISYA